MEEIKLRDFEISFAIEKSLNAEKFTFGNELVDLLNSKLKLLDYSENIKCLFVVFQCFKPDNKYVQAKERYSYRRKNQALEIYLNLDYTEVRRADEQTLKQMVWNSYLLGIEKFLKHKEFNIDGLVKDIKSLFK